MQKAPAIFDTALREAKLARANRDNIVCQTACAYLSERLDDIQRIFPNALYMGSGEFAHSKIGTLTHLPRPGTVSLPDDSFDLIAMSMLLHGVEDIPACLAACRSALKEDGLLLINFPGGTTLHELRLALTDSELERTGGVHPRVFPFVHVRDAGMLLQRAGFALPVVDSDTITLTYETMFNLMQDLRDAGETNALIDRTKAFTPKGLFTRALQIYAERFTQADGRITATLDLVTMTAWKPHASQQKPLARGSATHALADALGTKPHI